jgi:hypothetical protein
LCWLSVVPAADAAGRFAFVPTDQVFYAIAMRPMPYGGMRPDRSGRGVLVYGDRRRPSIASIFFSVFAERSRAADPRSRHFAQRPSFARPILSVASCKPAFGLRSSVSVIAGPDICFRGVTHDDRTWFPCMAI